ncbi:hypothetical protein MMC18_009402 [Xylographa bjoerkii]|nr:hypothetical protein [Xylographa bjoerkii]
MWPLKPLVPHQTALLGTSLYTSTLAFIFATLALVAGWRATVLEKSAILTWYSAHYLAVCKGTWASSAQAAKAKNLSTVTCEARPGGYVFALAAELAADAVPAAGALFAGWEYGTVRTMPSLVPLAGGLGFVGLTLGAVLRAGWDEVPGANVGVAVVAAGLLLVAAAVVSVQVGRVGEGGVTAEGSRGFAVFVWVAAGLMVLVVGVNVGMWRLAGEGRGRGRDGRKRPLRWWKADGLEVLPSEG